MLYCFTKAEAEAEAEGEGEGEAEAKAKAKPKAKGKERQDQIGREVVSRLVVAADARCETRGYRPVPDLLTGELNTGQSGM